MLTDGEERDVLVGDVRKRRQSLPTAPARRLRVTGSDDVTNLRMQAVSTDQQIPLDHAPVRELDPHPVGRTGHFCRSAVVLDVVGRKAGQQSFKQHATRDHADGRPQPVHDRGQVQGDERASSGRHDPHGGQKLTGSVHIDAQLLQNCCAVGPDGDGSAAGPCIRPLFEDGDVVSVPQQSPGNGDAAHACADNQDPQRHASERAPQAFPPHAERLRRIRPVRTGASRLWHHSAVFGGDS